MIKPAKTKFDIEPLIKKRFSPKGYSNESITKEEINRLLEAASWAASSYNEQPWRFLIGMKGNGEGFDKLFSCLSEKNKMWANTAQALLLVLSKKILERNGHPNRFHSYDTGQAVAMLSIQAVKDNIFISQMGGFDVLAVKKLFSIPDDLDIHAIIALGKIHYEQQVEKSQSSGEVVYRTRKELTEFVFNENLNTPYSWI